MRGRRGVDQTWAAPWLLVLLFCLTTSFAASQRQRWNRVDHFSSNTAFLQTSHEVIFAIKQQNLAKLEEELLAVSTPGSPTYQQFWTREEVASLTANPASTAVVEQFIFGQPGVAVTSKTPHGEYVRATATVEAWNRVFNTTIHAFFDTEQQQAIRRAESIDIPSALKEHVHSVLNLVFSSTFSPTRRRSMSPGRSLGRMPNSSYFAETLISNGYVTPGLLNKFYGVDSNTVSLPAKTNVSQCIYSAIEQSYSPSDLNAFANHFGFSTPYPTIIDLGDYSRANNTACKVDANNCIETNLDLQYITAMANNVKTYSWYDAENDLMVSWIFSVSAMVNPPSVISISYGISEVAIINEGAVGLYYVSLFDTEAMKVGLMGTTILVASGDQGSIGQYYLNIACSYDPSWPASSPYVTSVGATMGPETGAAAESVCSAAGGSSISSGGGLSLIYTRPSWQSTLVSAYTSRYGYSSSGRGLPDVSVLGNAYLIAIGGYLYVVSGTSASSPVFAGMLSLINAARANAGLSTLGWLNPTIYSASASTSLYGTLFNDVTSGSNNNYLNSRSRLTTCSSLGYSAAVGWDPATGLGSPKFLALKAYLLSLVPTARPTPSPSALPSAVPTPLPSSQPVLAPPTPTPTAVNTSPPTGQPSTQPSMQPSRQPTRQPSGRPTGQPSRQPTRQPTMQPSSQPSRHPTRQPTVQPTSRPTRLPSGQPSMQPSRQPTSQPSGQPTRQPASRPSSRPTGQPSRQPSCQPSRQPTRRPSLQPTSQPTGKPSKGWKPSYGSRHPTGQPSSRPTSPTGQPSRQPSVRPSRQPSGKPTGNPSDHPTSRPTRQPTRQPTMQPSSKPSGQPSAQPSRKPTGHPTRRPTGQPSRQPSAQPTGKPTMQPAGQPTGQPTRQPTTQPTLPIPTPQPTAQPTMQPTREPTALPSPAPSAEPSALPSPQPSAHPTPRPSAPTAAPTALPTRLPTAAPSLAAGATAAPTLVVQQTVSLTLSGLTVDDVSGNAQIAYSLRWALAQILSVDISNVGQPVFSDASVRRRLGSGVQVQFLVASTGPSTAAAAGSTNAALQTSTATSDFVTYFVSAASSLNVASPTFATLSVSGVSAVDATPTVAPTQSPVLEAASAQSMGANAGAEGRTIYISVAVVVAVLCGVGLASRNRLCVSSKILVSLRGGDRARDYETNSDSDSGDDVWKDFVHDDDDEDEDGVAENVPRAPSFVASA